MMRTAMAKGEPAIRPAAWSCELTQMPAEGSGCKRDRRDGDNRAQFRRYAWLLA